jgi:putative phosphoribosyl transferase
LLVEFSLAKGFLVSTPMPTWLRTREVVIRDGSRRMVGSLSLPDGPRSLVAFAHGSGSGRFSTRNQFVARALQQRGMATLLLDLLEEQEAEDRRNTFDIALLAQRLDAAAQWLGEDYDTRALPLGYFGASTGAAAALVAAVAGTRPRAIVSRGGRPDLAGDALPQVTCPTLLIVGENDEVVLDLNRQALNQLTCVKQFVVVPNATHLFPEPGTLEEVARWAGDWFTRYLTPSSLGA